MTKSIYDIVKSKFPMNDLMFPFGFLPFFPPELPILVRSSICEYNYSFLY